MQQLKVAIVLVANKPPDKDLEIRTSEFLLSVNSIISQATQARLEIIVVSTPGSADEIEYRQILDNNPWVSSVRFITGSLENATSSLSAENAADYLLILSVGDVLLPGAIGLMLETLEITGTKAGYAACRWSQDGRSWSHPAVDQFFELPAVVDVNPALLADIIKPTAIGIFHSCLFTRATLVEPERLAILKEYVCTRVLLEDSTASTAYLYPKRQPAYPTPIAAAQMPMVSSKQNEGNRGTWLFGERAGEAAEDNAWALFQYCVDACPDIESFYVINSASITPPQAQNRVLIKGSARWKKYIKQASHFFFTDSAADILDSTIDVLNHPHATFVYLTHGYLGYSPGVYQRGHPYINHVICTSFADVDAASRSWGFPKSKFIRCGLPRWDRLEDSSADRREILILPTWRKIFDSPDWPDAEELSVENISFFESSLFFKRFSGLLQSKKLHELLEAHDCRLTFSAHFRIRKYLPLFNQQQNSRINIATPGADDRNVQAMMQDASLLVTDYSSVMFDMGQMEKPVICYQFDKPAMLGERKIEAFSIHDAQMFTKTFYTQAGVIQGIEDYLQSNFSLTSEQKKRLNQTLPFRDHKNCMRVVAAIQQTDHRDAVNDANASQIINEATVESYLQQVEGIQIDASTRVAYLLNVNTTETETHIELRPENWKEVIATGNIHLLLVEPHLNAASAWAPILFSPEKLSQFFTELIAFARLHGVKSVLFEPAYPLFFEALYPQRNDFDRYISRPVDTSSSVSYDISVIIPAFNCEQFIGACIDSVLNQNFSGTIEVVVINDGSTDATWDKITAYTSRHANVIGISQTNTRQGRARNLGLQAARGEFITFLDADDVLPANALAELMHEINISAADIALGLVASSDESGKAQRINQSYFHYSKAPGRFSVASWPHVFYDPSCVGKLISRRFLLEHNIFFPQSYHEDQLFNFKLFACAPNIAKTNTVVYLYIARPAISNGLSGTQTFSADKLRQILLVAQLAEWVLEESALPARIKRYALGFLITRYDRFIWKQASLPMDSGSLRTQNQALGLLASFLEAVPDETIWKAARHLPLAMLMLKRQQFELANRALNGDTADAISLLGKDNNIPETVLDTLKKGGVLATSYNYYKAVPIGLDQANLVSEMSTAFRLGTIFVDIAKQPAKLLLVPFRLAYLAFDKVSQSGRKKQKLHKQEIARLYNSEQLILEHSNVVKSTAAYRLGVVIIEAFTTSPLEIFKLPQKIKQIYSQTK